MFRWKSLMQKSGDVEILRWAETATMTASSQSISNTPQSGDLLFWTYHTDDSSGDEGVTPTGWTEIRRGSDTPNAYSVFYKISDGTETSVAHGITASLSLSTGTYVLACFTNVSTVSTTASSTTDSSNSSVLSLGTVGATDVCVQSIGVDDQVSGVAIPSGFEEALIATAGTSGNGTTVAVAYAVGSNSGNWTNDDEPQVRGALRYLQ